MAVTYGFYDSLNHDRLYNAQQMSAIFDGIINDGVFMSVGNQFHTVAGTGMQVIVKSGRAWFDSTWTLNDAEYPLSIDAADVLLTRIDAVVLEVNSEVATRANTIKVVKGTPASTPAKPTLTNTAAVHQHALAYVTVAKNITAITNSMIEIVVGKTETPYVTAILQTTDITDLYNQWEDYFQTWFDNVRSTRDGDVALNLQNQITTLERNTLLPSTPPRIGLPSSATGNDMFLAFTDCGNLHTWRETTTTSAEVPASIKYDTPITNVNTVTLGRKSKSVAWFKFQPDALTVYDNGSISLEQGRDPYYYWYKYTMGVPEEEFKNANGSTSQDLKLSEMPGHYIYFWAATNSWISNSIVQNTWYYIPPDATVSVVNQDSTIDTSKDIVHFSKLQKVIGVPKQEKGLNVKILLNVDKNAYKEYNNSQPASYAMGEVVNGKFTLTGPALAAKSGIEYGTSVTVLSDGTVKIVNPSSTNLQETSSEGWLNQASKLLGKFFNITYTEITPIDFELNKVYFMPANATFSCPSNQVCTNMYQKVYGYAAVTANSYRTYLGLLGNKNQTQVVHFIGTGADSATSPASITFNFAPSLVMFCSYYYEHDGDKNYLDMITQNARDNYTHIDMSLLTTDYQKGLAPVSYNDYSNGYAKKSSDGKTLYWYNTLNSNGYRYLVLAVE